MKTTKSYVDNLLNNKPPKLPNYFTYNLNHKKEICYIFRLHAGTTVVSYTMKGENNVLHQIVDPIAKTPKVLQQLQIFSKDSRFEFFWSLKISFGARANFLEQMLKKFGVFPI